MLDFPTHTVGVELTEVVARSLAQADAIANKHYPSAVVDASLFLRETQLAPQEIHQHLQSADTLAGPGWSGDSVEREWAAGVLDAINDKTDSLKKSGYRQADAYWLVAYVSTPGPALDLEVATKLLSPFHPLGQRHGFSVVFILTTRSAVVLTEAGVAEMTDDMPEPSSKSLERSRAG
ncbi:MAG: hypothetical protein J0L64_26735 [Acidobacteria bacterium]|nr:hypothetical protein [Acidobacteriota bacterium]